MWWSVVQGWAVPMLCSTWLGIDAATCERVLNEDGQHQRVLSRSFPLSFVAPYLEYIISVGLVGRTASNRLGHHTAYIPRIMLCRFPGPFCCSIRDHQCDEC